MPPPRAVGDERARVDAGLVDVKAGRARELLQVTEQGFTPGEVAAGLDFTVTRDGQPIAGAVESALKNPDALVLAAK